ncbi:hypothetical protein [Clostridium pasteurianum]|uniref:Uncharacterized protein n=1 Tax=Clostridium pasteurianum BC1 TaxID=86416 RepID=R4K1C8_CLOPA|nr:hypothetical protein [Clostridium pasteurianum]AGK95546.1 hypothetical protein Clopa_0493 [Clostridium pasteurianum BC1]
MYASSYNRLFWGMIVLIFHINLGPINVLPNFAGYMLIYSGLNILSSQHKIYEKGKLPAIILVILTLKDVWHNKDNSIMIGSSYNLGLVTMLIGAVTAVVDLYLIYIICKGICELCRERELDSLMTNTADAWKFYFVISLIFLFSIPFSINLPVGYNIFLFIVGMIKGIAIICIMVMFRKCRVQLGT